MNTRSVARWQEVREVRLEAITEVRRSRGREVVAQEEVREREVWARTGGIACEIHEEAEVRRTVNTKSVVRACRTACEDGDDGFVDGLEERVRGGVDCGGPRHVDSREGGLVDVVPSGGAADRRRA